jgi:hypothetical protein
MQRMSSYRRRANATMFLDDLSHKIGRKGIESLDIQTTEYSHQRSDLLSSANGCRQLGTVELNTIT